MKGSNGSAHRAARKKAITRSPNLTTARIAVIVDLIRDGPSGVTWDEVLEMVASSTGDRYCRQALSKNGDIRIAYKAKQMPAAENVDKKSASKDPGETSQEAEIKRLRSRILELELFRSHLLERFSRWIVNAGQAGLDEKFLDNPLPEIARAKNY